MLKYFVTKDLNVNCMATYDILLEKTLRVPTVQEKATRQLQSALYNLRSVVRDEQRGSEGHYWERDYG